MGRITRKKVLIIDPDARGERIFSRGSRKNLRTGQLVWGRIFEYMNKKGKIRQLEPILYTPAIDERDFPNLEGIRGIIIPGSIYAPNDETLQKIGWMNKLVKVILKAHIKGIPMLGICFGHQAIAKALMIEPVKFGDKFIAEIGFHSIQLTKEGKKDRLFDNLPSSNMQVAFFHYWYVPKLPKVAVLLATGQNCDIQAFRIGRTTWGVQFHPDYDTMNMKELVRLRQEVVKKLPYNPHLSSTPIYNQKVLDNFLDVVMEH